MIDEVSRYAVQKRCSICTSRGGLRIFGRPTEGLLTEVQIILGLEVSIRCQMCETWRKLRVDKGVAPS